jgi:hypothetical protein
MMSIPISLIRTDFRARMAMADNPLGIGMPSAHVEALLDCIDAQAVEISTLQKQLYHARMWATYVCDHYDIKECDLTMPTTDTWAAVITYCRHMDGYKNVIASDGWKVGDPLHE